MSPRRQLRQHSVIQSLRRYFVNMIKRSSCTPLCSTPKNPNHRWWLELPAAMDGLTTDLHYFATYIKYLFTEKPCSAVFLLQHNTIGQFSTEMVIHTKYCHQLHEIHKDTHLYQLQVWLNSIQGRVNFFPHRT